MIDFAEAAQQAAGELAAAAAATDPSEVLALAEAIRAARRIVCHGLGREGLMMRALAMRLCHLGCDAHVWGDMSMPPAGPGDLVILSSGPGDTPTIAALAAVARGTGARIACITAQPGGAVPRAADNVLTIPAQTMADDQGAGPASVLPMGSVFEGAQFLVFEVLILMLRDRMAVSANAMRARHTNLE